MKRILISLTLMAPCMFMASQVWVYDYPDTLVYSTVNGRNFRSFQYDVRIRQGEKLYTSYVLADYNTFPDGARSKMTEWNHSTTFSFAEAVSVEVMKKDSSDIGKCSVYPLTLDIPYVIEDGNKLVISLQEPRKLFVEMEGMKEHPLFIFADPPETDVPEPDDPDVELITTSMTAQEVRNAIHGTSKSLIYFEEGLHWYGEQTDKTYPGYQLPVLSNKTYYIPGGTFIVGSFLGNNVNNTTIRGRGIISACGKERLAQAASIPYNLVYLENGGANQVIEGLTFTNPAHFVVLSRGNLAARNLKMFGWWHQTDGFGGEDGSSLHDSFIKVNDDFVKVYRDKQRYSNLVIYKQINGAAFQLGWNAYGSATNCKVWDIYIVKDDEKTPGPTSNTAVISLVNNDGSRIRNNSFERIYIENDVQRTIGIKVQGGSLEGLTVTDLHHRGRDNADNYLIAEDGGFIKGISFLRNFYGEDCMESRQEYNMRFEGPVEDIYFIGCPTNGTGRESLENMQGILSVTCMDEPGCGGTLYVTSSEGSMAGSFRVYGINGQLRLQGMLDGYLQKIPITWSGLCILNVDSDRGSLSGKYLVN